MRTLFFLSVCIASWAQPPRPVCTAPEFSPAAEGDTVVKSRLGCLVGPGQLDLSINGVFANIKEITGPDAGGNVQIQLAAPLQVGDTLVLTAGGIPSASMRVAAHPVARKCEIQHLRPFVPGRSLEIRSTCPEADNRQIVVERLQSGRIVSVASGEPPAIKVDSAESSPDGLLVRLDHELEPGDLIRVGAPWSTQPLSSYVSILPDTFQLEQRPTAGATWLVGKLLVRADRITLEVTRRDSSAPVNTPEAIVASATTVPGRQGEFKFTLAEPLRSDDRVTLVASNPPETLGERVYTVPSLIWSNTFLYLTAGLQVAPSGKDATVNPKLGLTLDSRLAGGDRGSLYGFFGAELSGVPALSLQGASAGAPQALESSNSLAAEAGIYGAWSVSSWTFGPQQHFLAVGPLFKFGYVDAFNVRVPADRTRTSSINVGGARIGHFVKDSKAKGAPRLDAHLDVLLGWFHPLQSLVPGALSGSEHRIVLNGVMTIPLLPFCVGFTANSALEHGAAVSSTNDLRIWFGVRLPIDRLLSGVAHERRK